ncbi:MAG: O-antigen ligase family protein [Proteobacteria bacterium]|nr:O-antigen ligase family protein [Pseudomonadota bacterium]
MSLTGITFTLVFAALCVLALVRHPVWGAMAYVGTYFFSPQLHWWGQGVLADVRWSYIAAAVTALGLLSGGARRQPTAAVMRSPPLWMLLLFVLWLALQQLWALDPDEHADLLTYYIKFVVALVLICKCIDSGQSLRLLLYTHVAGCFYFGWIAFTSYSGGRFEEFGGAGMNEANAAALAMGTGVLVAAGLFLAGGPRAKAVLLGAIPFILNGMVATISRSGFLSLLVGGLTFNFLTPRASRRLVRVLTGLAIVLFLILAGPSYWTRMHSIEHAGEDVEGVDTGEDRLAIINAQWRMFHDHPLGCGASCTTVLSPRYLPDKYLADNGAGVRQRASHNTLMTMLVEHGVPGVLFYLGMFCWALRAIWRAARTLRQQNGFLARVFPGIAGVVLAMHIGDMFVSYTKFEIRYWYIAILIALPVLIGRETQLAGASDAARTAPPGAGPAGTTAAAARAPGGSGNPEGWR